MPDPIDPLHIRNMSRQEIDLAIEWAAQEGWDPGLHDAEPFYQADPNGFFAGEVHGEVVAMVSLVSYPGDLSFGGFFIVRQDMRARGIGGKMLRFFLARGRDRNIGIDGVAHMVPTYEKSGFRFSYWNHRYRGIGGGSIDRDLVPVPHLPYDRIVNYDSEVFTTPREAFLRSFLSQPGTVALASLDNGKVAGYGALRPCRTGYKIGPLFADDPVTAEKLLRGLVSHIPGKHYFLDVPEPNKEGMHLADRWGLNEVFRTARLYTKREPAIPLDRVFGVTSYELG